MHTLHVRRRRQMKIKATMNCSALKYWAGIKLHKKMKSFPCTQILCTKDDWRNPVHSFLVHGYPSSCQKIRKVCHFYRFAACKQNHQLFGEFSLLPVGFGCDETSEDGRFICIGCWLVGEVISWGCHLASSASVGRPIRSAKIKFVRHTKCARREVTAQDTTRPLYIHVNQKRLNQNHNLKQE